MSGISPDDFRPLPLAVQPDEQALATRATAEALLAEANRMHRTAQDEAGRTLSAARADAQRIRDDAKAEVEQRQKRDDTLDTWAARAVIAGAVGLTASGEYSLARMVGFDREVAWLLPFVIDVYVIQAFRRHRDMMQAIGLTIAANVIYHLADAGLFGLRPGGAPQWWLIALVASVASLILWRMHQMVAPPKAAKTGRKWRRRDRQKGPVAASATAASTPPPAPPTGDSDTAESDRRNEAPVAASKPPVPPGKTAPSVAKKATPRQRQQAAKKVANKRRSMGEWVTDAGPVFHAEFKRLRRNPTATEFAVAIGTARLGKVSASTAKNIRAEILDRTPLPDLDGAE